MIPSEYVELYAKLHKEAEQIQIFSDSSQSDDANIMVEYLKDLNHYLSRTAVMLADAKMIHDKAIVDTYLAYDFDGTPASVTNKMVASMCGDTNKLVTWIERLNRGLVHIGENLRTQISFCKEQLKLTRNGY